METFTNSAAPTRSGLHVSITGPREGGPGSPLVVTMRITGGVAPIRLGLYVDGGLIEEWTSAPATCACAVDSLTPGRHALTVRAVDALGRWRGASAVLEVPARSTFAAPKP
jgi:Big-like domain-containing protein